MTEEKIRQDLKAQISKWENKREYYVGKKDRIKLQFERMLGKESSIIELPIGDPRIDDYYKRLGSLDKQIRTLPEKIHHCEDNISTLKACMI